MTADFDVNVSRARFRDDDPAGNHIPGATRRTLSGGLAYARGPWSGGLRVRYFGSRPLLEDDSVRSASSTLVNGELGIDFGSGWAIAVEAFNLLDAEVSDIEYFYASRLRGEPEEGVEDVHFHPSEPFSLRVGIRKRF